MPRKRGNPNFGKPAPVCDLSGPSEWSVLLSELGIAERDAVFEIAARSVAGERIRRYAKSNGHRRFVPEAVLHAAGVNPDRAGHGRGWWN